MDIPTTMKAAVLFNYGDLRVTQKPVPALDVGEALVKVDSIAICGSDPAIIAKGWQNHPPLGEFTPGHEFTGTVVEVAPDGSGGDPEPVGGDHRPARLVPLAVRAS